MEKDKDNRNVYKTQNRYSNKKQPETRALEYKHHNWKENLNYWKYEKIWNTSSRSKQDKKGV